MNTQIVSNLPVAATIGFAASHLSPSYQHVRTLDLLDPLFAEGWVIDQSKVKRSRSPEHAGHAFRLSNPNLAPATTEYKPQIVVRNGSNGDTALQVSAGLYRFACANGIVSGASALSIRVCHRGANLQDRIIAAARNVTNSLPILTDAVQRWTGVEMTLADEYEFAQEAAALRWDLVGGDLTVDMADMIAPRRFADSARNLWMTFNRVQESVVRGGVRVTRNVATNDEAGNTLSVEQKTRASRAVNSIDKNLDINKRLWNLAEAFAS